MSLYTLTTTTSTWRIKKFDEDFNLESEYDVDEGMCTCPQSHKPTCRHRQMFVEFFNRDHVDDGWFLEFDANGDHKWHRPIIDKEELKEDLRKEVASVSSLSSTPTTTETAQSSAPSAATTKTPQPAPSSSEESTPAGGVISFPRAFKRRF